MVLEIVTSSLQAERRAFEDILANSIDCLLAVSFTETFQTLHQWVYRVRFSLKIMIFFPYPLFLLMAWLQCSMPSLTIMVIWHQWIVLVTSVCYKTLFDRSCGTLRHVLFCGGCKMALQPNVQMQFSHFSMRSFEVESSAEEQRTRGQHTLRTLTSSTSIFGRIRKIRIFKEKLNSIDSLLQWVKSFAERLQPTDNQ